MAKKTEPNTGLGITRKDNKFTASWKIAAKSAEKQWVRYRTYNGKAWGSWTTKTINKKTTSYSVTYAASSTITQVQFQTRIKRTDYKASAWTGSSAVFKITAPNVPTLSVTNDSANQTTFTISANSSSTGSAWYYRCLYRTKCTTTPNAATGWSAWTAAGASYTYTDNTTGTVRILQVKAVGPGGTSAVKTQRHYIGPAPSATWQKKPCSYTVKSSYYQLTCNFNLKGDTYTIDQMTPQYHIGEPDATMACPSGASWTDGADFAYSNGKTAYSVAVTTASLIGDDECLWVRIRTEHDSVYSYSTAYRVLTGVLAAPTATFSMGTITTSGFDVTVTITDDGTNVPGAYKEVYLEKYSQMGIEHYILIGTIPNGTASATINSTEDISSETGYAIHVRNVTAVPGMVSPYVSYTSGIPTAPTLNSVTATTTSGKVLVQWTNNWSDATGAIVAWTTDPDNWMSNEEPESYEITEQVSAWYLVGLETGVKWYVRVRSVLTDGENVTYSPWSADVAIDLASAPAIPVLQLSEEAITEEGMVTAYWAYVTTDGTAQIAGEIVEATYSGGVWTYGNSVGSTTNAQHIDIYAKEQGWTNGTTVYLALRTRSGSGGLSDYSEPVQLMIAAEPTVTISSTGLASSQSLTEYFEGDGATVDFDCSRDIASTPTAEVEGSAVTVSSYSGSAVTLASAPSDGDEVAITYTTQADNVLNALPLSVTVTAANAESVTLAIERAETYPMIRPDGTFTDGAEGETVYISTVPIESTNLFTVRLGDLIGRLDDGAYYNLVATVRDRFGQEAVATERFYVHWTHQAEAPTATVTPDTTNYIAKITPVAPAGYQSGDTCDIYRMSVDGPELIYKGATFGTEYVDPFPAFGQFSGYKCVTVTKYGDYITEDNTIADYEPTYTKLDPGTLVIDFGGDRAELPYNITLNNSWTKDFQRTTYLGGHITGDHNRAVTRDLTAGTVLVRDVDEDTGELMRELAQYAGICHVRTPEGSSFAADVQVTEARAYNSASLDYNLAIKQVDTVGYDGLTYSEWSALQ